MIFSSKSARVLAAATMAATVTTCVGQATPVHATTSPSTAVTIAAAVAQEIPDTPAGAQLGWLLEAATRPPVPESELTEHFAAAFLQSVPPATLNEVLTAFKDMRLERVTQSQDSALSALVVAGGKTYELLLSVDGAGLIGGLQFREPAVPAPTPKSWAELEERLSKVAPQASFLAAEVTRGGDCRPVRAVARDRAQPLGSMFKLYVLGAVAQRIKSGAFGWDTELTIRPELKSLPSGELQDRPDNSKVTVLEAAKLMISISDNTATDLLIHKVGRKTVERTMRSWGGHDERNVPFLTTRELFVLKGAGYPRHAERYLSMSTARQRAYLEKVVAKVPRSEITPWSEPRALDTLEWFGSPTDVCQVYSGLAKLRDPRVGEVLSINDAGLGLNKDQWPTVWFKGGSEPGVLDMSHLARTPDGRTYVVTAMALNPDTDFGPQTGQELLALIRGAFTLVR
ncbi:serine hydrolase [Nonomuraea sp. K274]|uniref:Serine hydrolase n=1 Tax=Nonomuraea cypriaca TaxID=1187855 RepID=A0A931F099_9ACTN|nr:serine hydrolase [Nonomuraea cypriaca]MBF8190669.1 serine hydrolase [Nonomuraea cypriaca]